MSGNRWIQVVGGAMARLREEGGEAGGGEGRGAEQAVEAGVGERAQRTARVAAGRMRGRARVNQTRKQTARKPQAR